MCIYVPNSVCLKSVNKIVQIIMMSGVGCEVFHQFILGLNLGELNHTQSHVSTT